MMKPVAFLLLLFALAACGPKTMVVVVPDDDGHVGKVNVESAKESRILGVADESVVVTDTISKPKVLSQAQIQKEFGQALAAAPAKPDSILLYFKSESAEPDAASLKLIPKVVEIIKTRPIARITVIGHTDDTGDRTYNDRLSIARAESVRKLLVRAGLDPDVVTIHGFGPNDPLVPSVPGKSTPLNRRVEIFIR